MELDINLVRSLVTAGGFCCFVAIILWAFSKSARKGFDEAAMLPFQDEEAADVQSASRSKSEG
ncbi:cbb3-type cytochrome oxidase subunit 3 [Uliginosibacterium sp. TH139]|uniref:cbb3-type cytochrome oxidase subunit 3 n=1 Tax=Uliginosibacterium sp. TH139 TaxID=2067453 RepID=UPI0026D1418E